ncbi:MAG: hypothetical protein OXB99_06020 [Acidimicrobiaceae bacterium]|nr:hypothetical protein [Acidimicrobiaceae bacterium]
MVGIGAVVAGTVDVVDSVGSDATVVVGGSVVGGVVVSVTGGDEVAGVVLAEAASGASGAHDAAARQTATNASTTPRCPPSTEGRLGGCADRLVAAVGAALAALLAVGPAAMVGAADDLHRPGDGGSLMRQWH